MSDGKRIPEVTTQMLIDAGLNAFGLQLFIESIAVMKDAATFSPMTFRFRGIKFTMEPDGPIECGVKNKVAP